MADPIIIQLIPTSQDVPDYTLRTRLEGSDYNLRFMWNQREERWYMTISTDAGELLAAGVKIIPNWPLLRYYQWDRRLPQGTLMAMDLTNDGSPPGLSDFAIDKRVTLTYFPVGTLPTPTT